MNDEEKQKNPLILMANLATQDPKDTAKNADRFVQNHKMAIASLLSPSAINDDNNSVVVMTTFLDFSKDSDKQHHRQYIIDDIEAEKTASRNRKPNLVPLPRLSEAIGSTKFATDYFPSAIKHQFHDPEFEVAIYGNRSCESNNSNYTLPSNAPNSRRIISMGNNKNDWEKAGGNFANQTINHQYHTGHGFMQSRSNFPDNQSQILHDNSVTMNQKSVFSVSGNQLNGKLPQFNSTTPNVGGSSGTNDSHPLFINSDKKRNDDQIILQKSSKKKRHRCDICGSAFARPSSLLTHMRTHTGERPFVCPYPGCGKAFSIRNNQIRHYRLHTRDITKKPLLVSDETTSENQ